MPQSAREDPTCLGRRLNHPKHRTSRIAEHGQAAYARHIRYTTRHDVTTDRSIECVALLLRHPAWYILAWDLDKDAARMFRMDRIARPEVGRPVPIAHDLRAVTEEACPTVQAHKQAFLGSALAT